MIESLGGVAKLKDSISKSRLHLEGDTLFYESNTEFNINKNNIKLKPFKKKSLFFGGVNAVSPKSSVADERRGGFSIID